MTLTRSIGEEGVEGRGDERDMGWREREERGQWGRESLVSTAFRSFSFPPSPPPFLHSLSGCVLGEPGQYSLPPGL